MASDRRPTDFGSDPSEGKSHPVGKSVGAVAGAIAGGAAGSIAGPIGTVGGAAIGGIAGWLEGKTIAEGISPDTEMRYWGDNFRRRSYYSNNREWRDYEPAYLTGVYSYDPDLDFSDVEEDLERDWTTVRGESRLEWREAREASRDAWKKLSEEEEE